MDESVNISQHSSSSDDPTTQAAVSDRTEPAQLTQTRGCYKRTRLFAGYAIQDVGRNKCHFCLAFCSVFVVVLSILVVNTIIAAGPLVFLTQAEKYTGQIDAIFAPSDPGLYTQDDYLYFYSSGLYYNYTQV